MVQVPKPKGLNGTRSVKELENFLYDMEQFFKASYVADEKKVSIIGEQNLKGMQSREGPRSPPRRL